jgi:hypothetical protein
MPLGRLWRASAGLRARVLLMPAKRGQAPPDLRYLKQSQK